MKYFFILGAMAMTFVAQAQWTSDLESNTLAAESSLSIVQSLGASDGSTYVVYWKEVGALANLELRLQRLNADGAAALGPAGILVSSEINMSTCIDLVDVDATALSEWRVSDVQGRSVSTLLLNFDRTGKRLRLDVSTLPTGFYHIQGFSRNGQVMSGLMNVMR